MSRKPRLLTHVLLLLAALAYLAPLLWMIDTSLKHEVQAVQVPPVLIPHPVRWQNYVHVLRDPQFDFSLFARNTLIIATLSSLGAMLSSSLVAYSLAKIRWRGRGLVFGIVLASMMIPFPVFMVPLYRIFRELGWIGTNLPLWVPAFFGIPFFHFSPAAVLFDHTERTFRSGGDGWLLALWNLVAHYDTAYPAGAAGGGIVFIYERME